MIPVLSTNTTLTGNGIGLLSDAITCRVTHEINGEYEFRMTYPVTGQHYGDLQVDSVIWATPDNMTAKQPFRIYRITRPLNQVVTVYARHAAYDASGVVVEPVTAASLTAALPAIAAACVPSCPLTLTTSRTVATQYKLTVPTPLWSVFGGIQGSLLDVYGGEWDFNGLTADLKTKLGADRGVDIRYGKNMTQLEQDVTVEATYAYVYPLWTDENGTLVTLPEKYITVVGAVGSRMMTLDLSDAFDTAPTEAQLRTRANKFITDNDPGTPKISWKVNMAQLSQSPEFQDMAILDQVQLGDTIRIFYEPMNLTATSRAVKTDYDVLSERYAGITLGRVKQNLASIVAASQKETDARFKTMKSMLEQAIDSATDFITNGAGYMRFIYNASNELQEIVSLDNPDIALAQSVWRWNNGGFGHSSTGYAGPYTTAITQNGVIVADFVTAGTMAGNRVRTGLIEDETGTNWWNLDTGDLHIHALTDIGGRNLLLASATKHIYPYSGATITFTDGVTVSEWGASDAINCTGSIGGNNVFATLGGVSALSQTSINGRSYVHSIYIKNNGTDDLTVTNNFLGTPVVVEPGGSKRVVIPGTGNGTSYVQFSFRTDSAFDFTYWHPQIEYGTIATDWTPAPEDMTTAIQTGDANTVTVINQEFSSQFNVLSDSITQTVERLDTLSNGLQDQISTTVQNTADGLTVNIQQAQATADGVQQVLDEYFEFLATGLRIRGTKGSSTGSYLNLAADEVGLYVNSTKRLWLTAGGANADYFNASEGVAVGSYLWEQYPGGFRLRKR